ncbi:MAG: TRAP transporter small permease [Synergistales bacterium]|nr:TRAP transporter small permease [Synergistales bacterium]
MRLIDYLEELLVVTSLLVMVIVNFGNVISRYLIHASWSFSEEIMVILFVYNSFLGASIAYKRGAHLGFTALTDLLPVSLRRKVVVLIGMLTVALMAVLSKAGYEMVQSQMMFNQRTPALGLPEWLAGASVPLGALLIILRVIQSTIIELRLLQVESFEGEQGGDA